MECRAVKERDLPFSNQEAAFLNYRGEFDPFWKEIKEEPRVRKARKADVTFSVITHIRGWGSGKSAIMEFLLFFFLFVFPLPRVVSLLSLPLPLERGVVRAWWKKYFFWGGGACRLPLSWPQLMDLKLILWTFVIYSPNCSGSFGAQKSRKGIAQRGVPEPKTPLGLSFDTSL